MCPGGRHLSAGAFAANWKPTLAIGLTYKQSILSIDCFALRVLRVSVHEKIVACVVGFALNHADVAVIRTSSVTRPAASPLRNNVPNGGHVTSDQCIFNRQT